ncbi:hypothetical protein A8E39_23780, partial [Burkholderia cenocepacia]
VAHRPDNTAETAGPAADTTQCASQRPDRTCGRVRYRANDATKAARRITATDPTQCTGYRTDHTTKTTGRITDATQGTRHRTHCTACRVAHRPDNTAETAGPAADTTQCASQRSDCTGGRVRYRADHATKATRRVTATDATQCTGYRTDHTTETTGPAATAQGARHRSDCSACRVAHRSDDIAKATRPATTSAKAAQRTRHRANHATKTTGPATTTADTTQRTRHRTGHACDRLEQSATDIDGRASCPRPCQPDRDTACIRAADRHHPVPPSRHGADEFPGRGRSACDDHAVGFADTSQRGSQHPRLGRRGGQAEQSRDRQGDACQFHVRFRFRFHE